MANNIMYLCHIPTGLAVPLGKRGGWGWSVGINAVGKVGASISALYELLQAEYDYGDGKQDDFAVVLEDPEDSNVSTIKAKYDFSFQREDGIVRLLIGAMP